MFGSKTTRMLAAIDRYRYQNKSFLAFKPKMDERYTASFIATHSGGKIPAICVDTGEGVLQAIEHHCEPVDIVAVDEVFMIPDIAKALIKLFQTGYTIITSSIQLSASNKVFDEIRDIMPWATRIEVCPAVCPICGADAYYTHRKVEDIEEIAVGGSELYEPRCWKHRV